MGRCLAHNETRFPHLYQHDIVYEEHQKFKGTKEIKKLRAEDKKKQTEDLTAKFPVLVRAKTMKKKIATLVCGLVCI